MAPPEVAVANPVAGHPSIHSFVETEYFDKIAKFSKPLNAAVEDNSVRCGGILLERTACTGVPGQSVRSAYLKSFIKCTMLLASCVSAGTAGHRARYVPHGGRPRYLGAVGTDGMLWAN